MLIFFFRKLCHVLHSVEKYIRVTEDTVDNKIRSMGFTCWITNAIETQWENVIVIAFLLQQWLPERTQMLSIYVHFPSFYVFSLLLPFNTGHILACYSSILVHMKGHAWSYLRSKFSENFDITYFWRARNFELFIASKNVTSNQVGRLCVPWNAGQYIYTWSQISEL